MRLAVQVVPRAREARCEWDGAVLHVHVPAPPEGGRANLAVVREVARWLGVPRAAVRIVAGHSARRKWLEVPDSPLPG